MRVWDLRTRDAEGNGAGAREFDGVVEEVAEDLAETGFVAEEGVREVGREVEVEREALGGGDGAVGFFEGGEEGAEGKGGGGEFQFAGFDGAEVEEISDEAEEVGALGFDGVGVAGGGGRLTAEEFGAAGCRGMRAEVELGAPIGVGGNGSAGGRSSEESAPGAHGRRKPRFRRWICSSAR